MRKIWQVEGLTAAKYPERSILCLFFLLQQISRAIPRHAKGFTVAGPVRYVCEKQGSASIAVNEVIEVITPVHSVRSNNAPLVQAIHDAEHGILVLWCMLLHLYERDSHAGDPAIQTCASRVA